ncbi:MAG: T9SS type A sorting domain-containing protein [Flavobacteriales bacterium]
MKNYIILFLISLSYYSFSQTHVIDIHPEGRVSSLLMTPQEYESWVANYDYGDQEKREDLFQDIYQKFEDDFDFIFLILKETNLPPNMPTGELKQVSNSIQGIGLNDFNDCSNYGSEEKLQSVIHLARFNYMLLGPSLHELMHNWGNFGITTHQLYQTGTGLNSFEFIPHWGFSGGSSKGQLGGFNQSTLVENGNNNYTVDAFGGFANGGNSVPFNEMELYLMGMIPLNQVSDFDVFKNITTNIDNNGTKNFTASERITYTSSLISSELGERIPNSINSQKDFKALAIVLTDSALTDDEWTQVDNDIVQFSHIGADQSSIYNFWEATNGLGTITFGNLFESVIDTSVIDTTDNTPNDSTTIDSTTIDSTVFINNLDIKNSYIYPNPTENIIHINGNSINGIQIYDNRGRKIKRFKTQKMDHRTTLYLNDLSCGLYLIKYEIGNKIITEKLIIR